MNGEDGHFEEPILKLRRRIEELSALPDEASVVAVIDAASDTPASERALGFGSEQLLLQHRGLFDLLEARAEARSDY